MNIKIISASAGSGKTWRLTEELERAIGEGRARPLNVLAVTFTTEAAADLVERSRARLLGHGRAEAAQELLGARIGTVNAVCGSFVAEYAFELGLSPALRVIDDPAAEHELRRSLARVVPAELAEELDRYRDLFEHDRDWRVDVRRIVEAARANGISSAALAASSARSIAELSTALGPTVVSDLDGELADALRVTRAEICASDDATAGTQKYVELLDETLRDLGSDRGLAWGVWAKLTRELPTKKSLDAARRVQRAAAAHLAHPTLRAQLERLIDLEVAVAADVLRTYQRDKQLRGVIDFVDQETLALELLGRGDVRDALAGQIDLFLVDEFQDTSPIELSVFLRLASLAKETIWVGDPKQAIFGFRGTDPALMDGAIESLASVSADPDLVDRAVRSVGTSVETLAVSYRSAPTLVSLTNEIFAPAFARHGLPAERTKLRAARTASPDAPPVISHWRLDGTTEHARAAAVATGVHDVVSRGQRCRELAVMCRTNAQCQAVADALGELGIAVVLPRNGLMACVEAQVVRAGLALWIDPRDRLAAAELARLLSYPDDLEGLVSRALEADDRRAFDAEPVVQAVVAARADLEPRLAVEAIVDALQLRARCAGWGDGELRLANLDALVAHATTYARASAANGCAATVLGFVHHVDELVPKTGGWRVTRADRQALVALDDAVTVTTWHRAKGLEWPVTVLYGLETLRAQVPFGVFVESDRTAFDVAEPLADRWVRVWPNPYNAANQLGPVRSALEQTSLHAAVVDRAEREALRVLYVGWTRARDRIVFASRPGKHFLAGILGVVAKAAPDAVREPAPRNHWSGYEFAATIASFAASSPQARVRLAGEVAITRATRSFPVARVSPSNAAPVPATIRERVWLGPRLALAGGSEMARVGDAIHAFLAADRASSSLAERAAMAAALLADHEVADSLAAQEVVAAASRLWQWLHGRCSRVCREWPIHHRLADGTIVVGTADLVGFADDRCILVDHKSFPGRSEAAEALALSHSGQLAAYAAALESAMGLPVDTWIHMPVRGELLKIALRH